MYLPDRQFNYEDIMRGVLRRNVDLLSRVAPKFLWPSEILVRWFDADGLGVWVGVWNTTRPEVVLRCAHKEVFRNFAFTDARFEGGICWTHFCAVSEAQKRQGAQLGATL